MLSDTTYTLQGIPACLLGPALPLFSNLRKFTARWRGDGLERTHLNCLKDVPLLEHLSVTYCGNVDLGPEFPEGKACSSIVVLLHTAVADPCGQPHLWFAVRHF
jgi:hypothetical protein